MIYVTGDTHGDWLSRFNTRNFPQQKSMTKDDFVIVCGDFGLWHDTKEERYNLDWLNNKPFTTLFVGGNHENYSRLYSGEFGVEEWSGGLIRRIRPSVLFLERGQVFTLEGKKIFCMGGARSHDIQDGILDPSDKNFKRDYAVLSELNGLFRVRGVSWWDEEMPSDAEYEEALKNLDEVGNDVDIIISHCCPTSVSDLISGGFYEPDKLTDFLETIKRTTSYKTWYFGHYHDNGEIDEKFILLYEKIVPLREKSRFLEMEETWR